MTKDEWLITAVFAFTFTLLCAMKNCKADEGSLAEIFSNYDFTALQYIKQSCPLKPTNENGKAFDTYDLRLTMRSNCDFPDMNKGIRKGDPIFETVKEEEFEGLKYRQMIQKNMPVGHWEALWGVCQDDVTLWSTLEADCRVDYVYTQENFKEKPKPVVKEEIEKPKVEITPDINVGCRSNGPNLAVIFAVILFLFNQKRRET